MIEKEQREVERRPITKITHKGEIEIESQEPVKAPEPTEVRLRTNILLLNEHNKWECLRETTWTSLFLLFLSPSLLPKWPKSQQNLQKPQRKKRRASRLRGTPRASTSLTCLTSTVKFALVSPATRRQTLSEEAPPLTNPWRLLCSRIRSHGAPRGRGANESGQSCHHSGSEAVGQNRRDKEHNGACSGRWPAPHGVRGELPKRPARLWSTVFWFVRKSVWLSCTTCFF